MDRVLEKIADPLRFYKKPIEVDEDGELSISEKIKVLTSWLDDIFLRQIAESENMIAPHESHYHTAEVERLLQKYKTAYLGFINDLN